MLRLKVEDVRGLRNAFSAVSVVVDEATFQLTPESVKLCAMDPSRVAMVDLELPRAAFSEYECSEPMKLCLSLEGLLKLLRKVGAGEPVELAAEGGRLKVNVSGRYSRSFTVPTLQPAEGEVKPPNVQLTVKAKMASASLRQALEDVEVAGELVTLEADAERLTFRTAGNVLTAAVEVSRGSECLLDLSASSQAKASFSLDFLLPIVKQSISEVATMEFASDAPLKLEFVGAEGSRLTNWLAPRVEPA